MMKSTNAAAAYRTATFDNAPPIKILRMLFEGAIRFLKYAEDLEPGTDDYRNQIRKTDKILGELRATLDHQPSPEIAANLENHYLFAQEELASAFLNGERERIGPVREVLETLLDGWNQAQVQLSRQNGAA